MSLLAGKTAIVTGGGQGIGLGISRQLLAAGASVLIAQRSPLPDELVAHENAHFVAVDLLQADAPVLIAEVAQNLLGGCDILVNNAGFMFEKHIEAMSLEDWDNMMIVNMRAPVFLAKALLPQMRQRGGGSIINIGSIEGLASNPLHAAYCASKAGVHGFSRALAVDLGKDNIRCNAIAPGWIESALSLDYINSQPDPESAREGLLKMHPVGRTGQPDDIGKTVVYLASDLSEFVTGQVITVDGGRTAKLPLPF